MESGKQRAASIGLAALLCIQASASWAGGIPFKAAAQTEDNLVYRAIGAFLLAGLAAYGLAWSIKRFLPAFGKSMGREKKLERLEVMRLSARSMLVRVRWGKEELLVGDGERGITLLGRRPAAEEPSAGEIHD